MHTKHHEFIAAIHAKRKLRITFYSEEDGGYLTRTCAPMDWKVGAKIKDGIPRYWVWDYDSDRGGHSLGLLAERIQAFEVLDTIFDPAEFVRWKVTNWSVARDWGAYS